MTHCDLLNHLFGPEKAIIVHEETRKLVPDIIFLVVSWPWFPVYGFTMPTLGLKWAIVVNAATVQSIDDYNQLLMHEFAHIHHGHPFLRLVVFLQLLLACVAGVSMGWLVALFGGYAVLCIVQERRAQRDVDEFVASQRGGQ